MIHSNKLIHQRWNDRIKYTIIGKFPNTASHFMIENNEWMD
jgi:hypothetical protein